VLLSSQEATEPETVQKEEKSIINPVPASEPLSETYFGKCVFVGDSISVGLADFQLVPVKNVFAELGMNIEKINTETMKTAYGDVTAIEALKEAKPENVYIMLGSNGIAWLSTADMIEYYSQFVDEIKNSLPDTKIYILSIPPVTAERETAEEEPILNSDIDKYNSELLKMADEKKIYYVDINTALKGNDGKFPADMAEKDGMHFVKTTYTVMLDYILSHTAGAE
ncbi:MAG: GDSL-type esterase/lipase family protein, partial [Porcipelethomonas sp.]